MSDFKVSWKYEIINLNREKRWELFQCDDCIKLELNYQVFLEAIKSK